MAFDGASAVSARPESFAIKGALLPMTLLELRSGTFADIDGELRRKVEVSPDFFLGSPIVLSVEALEELEAALLSGLLTLCRELDFRLVGLKGGDDIAIKFCAQHALAHFPAGKVRGKKADHEIPEPAVAPVDAPEAVATTERKVAGLTKTVNTPIRSGQQIFSEGDLIVLAPVSAGAELLAVGNIHVYGPMRGRALAGVQGDESARIFCMSQEAELVSIAGHFMIDENLRESCWKVAAQIHFDGDQLQVESITGIFS